MAVDVRARSLARAVDLPVRSFDLARPGVAPPLGVARIFYGVHFFSQKIDHLFSRRPQNTNRQRH